MTRGEQYATQTMGEMPSSTDSYRYGEWLVIRNAYEKGAKDAIDLSVAWLKERFAYYNEHPEVNILNDFRRQVEACFTKDN